MFIMPTPPTTSEISATTNRRLAITRLVEARVCEFSVKLWIRKSSSAPA
jgi:hypothetical protein